MARLRPPPDSTWRVGGLPCNKHGENMSRRNVGPKPKFLIKRNKFYICWTEHGREMSGESADAGKCLPVLAPVYINENKKSGVLHNPPKAEVTDSNSVGCANYFKALPILEPTYSHRASGVT